MTTLPNAASPAPTAPPTLPSEGRARTVIANVRPAVDAGRFPIKRVLGDRVVVKADAFADGHDVLRCLLCHRQAGADAWHTVAMVPCGNDRWQGEFVVSTLGRHEYTVLGWVDHFLTWRHDLLRRDDPADIAVAVKIGLKMLSTAASACRDPDEKMQLADWAQQLASAPTPAAGRLIAGSEALARLMASHGERLFISRSEHIYKITVDPLRARFAAWYELFPRSCANAETAHGNLADVIQQLPEIAAAGFDVLYLPPIHPIGQTFRKGPNNQPTAGPGDPGSPWAIGASEGGHKAIHPPLGSLDDLRRLVAEARQLDIELALDIAFQCSPDHPYVSEHPEWFRHRTDGSIQYAENPPKKYQDIYPFDFECDDWQGLWHELRSVVNFWIDQGVHIFRVDNPHTKPFLFWEWLIGTVKAEHPEVIFLAEAFTRPKIMQQLAKLGFSQSYTYFTWRNTKQELTDYFTELTLTEAREYFRPNLWPNTPDILPEFLQYGGRPAFLLRVALAATLGASYGIYGPAYELMEAEARAPGAEEYLDSEKYQIRHWQRERPDSLRDYIARLNRIRRENPALQADRSLRFHPIDNPAMLCYSKSAGDVTLVMVANLDPNHVQAGWLELPLAHFGIAAEMTYQAHDLLSGARFLWQGARNFVRLDPQASPVHILRLRRRIRSERDFDYFL